MQKCEGFVIYTAHYTEHYTEHHTAQDNVICMNKSLSLLKLTTMEATLKFNLPDDKGDFELAVKASAMYCVLWDFKQFMRDEIKYNGNLTDKEYELAERFQEKFFEILQDNAISLD